MSPEEAPAPRILAQELQEQTGSLEEAPEQDTQLDIKGVLQAQSGSFQDVTGLQRAGLHLVHWVLGAIFAAIVLIGVAWIVGGPPAPDVPADEQSAKAVAENYKTLREAYLDNGPRELFDTIITSGLVPILTLLLGYIFGTREASGSSGS